MDVRALADSNGFDAKDEQFAKFLDSQDELQSFRSEFHYPKNKTIPDGKMCFPLLHLAFILK